MSKNQGLKIGAGVVGAIVALEFAGYGPFSRSTNVQNIEKSWSRGGGGIDHTPAIASKRGDSDNVVGAHGHQAGYGNPSTTKQIQEMKGASTDNVAVARQKPIDRDTPSGSGHAQSEGGQGGQTIREPLQATSASESKR